MAFTPDGRILVCDQGGRLRVVKNNTLLPTPFVQLNVNSQGERGLIGVAVDPDFATNGYVYVYYTVNSTPARNRVSRFTANGDVAQSGSETVILNLDPLNALIHNGGAMHFGNDGKLYVAVGENSVGSNSQNLDTYHGKLLRINKDGSVPPGNPYTSGSEQRRRIWASGLRNPFTFSIDPVTGRILVNDVGGNNWEEINDATVGGRNFGWPTTEGDFNASTYPNFTKPVYAYPHGSGDGRGCAIVGGTFVNANSNYPSTYHGNYFYQENCNSWINRLSFSGTTATRSSFATGIAGNSLGMITGPDGSIYYLSRSGGAVYKVVYNSTATVTITKHPENANVAVGQPANFSVAASSSSSISYQWQKNNQDIPNATSATYTIPAAALTDAGTYRVRVSAGGTTLTSNPATLSVIANELPVAKILSPTNGTTYVAGTTVSFSGEGTDPEDGALPASAFTWEINFHHDTHYHDQPPITGVTSGTVEIPNVGETSDNVWYRLILTVKDSDGLIDKDSVDIVPMKSTLSFLTDPPGLQIMLDGKPVATPLNVLSVEGVLRVIDAPNIQSMNGVSYKFESWSHGGSKNQTITTPTDDTNYTAKFVEVATTAEFYRGINLNGDAVNIDGNNWEAGATAPDFSYTNANTFVSPNVTLIPDTDDDRASMIRSFIWGRLTATVDNIPPGDYEVWLYAFEDNYPTTFPIFIEGVEVVSDYNSGPGGTWQKLGPYPVSVSDGNISIYLGGFEANLSGIEIWSGSGAPVNSPPVVNQPIPDQTATADVEFDFTFSEETFSDPDSDTLSYTANLTTGQPLPSWLTFNGDLRNFSGVPNAGHLGDVDVVVTATDAGGAVATDSFKITVESISSAQWYRAVNLNGPGLIIDGNNWEASASAPNFTYSNAQIFSTPQTPVNPATDGNRTSMLTSFFWGRMNLQLSQVPPGDYEIYLYTFEDSSPASFSVLLEGEVVQENFSSGTAGSWSRLGPYAATINDGTINVSLTGYESNISGIEIYRGTGSGGNSLATAALESEELSLKAYPNPASSNFKVEFRASESGQSSLTMFDARGQATDSFFQGYVNKGEIVELNVDPSQMIDGLYILQFVNGEKSKRVKVLVHK